MTNRLINRVARVTVASPQPGSGVFFAIQPNAVVIENLRVKFSIERTVSKEPNTCEVTITNLAPQTRSQVEKKPQVIIIEAGYDGNFQKLFQGDLRYGMSSREGPDWNTKLQCGDGSRAFEFGRVNHTSSAGIDYKSLVGMCAGELGIKVPDGVNAAIGNKQAVTGYTMHGPAHIEMSRLMQPLGLEWSIQDGQLQALPEGVPRLDNRSAFVISQDTGMIGSPEYGAPPKPGQPPLLKVKTELSPGIFPGHQVKVTSRAINGLFRVEKVKHDGDTRGSEWTTELEVIQL